MQQFNITKELSVICETKNTRIAFKHTATLLRKGREIGATKICYQNRTWERYTYESVLEKLLAQEEKSLTTHEIKSFQKTIKNGDDHDNSTLKTVAIIATLGDVIATTQKEKNDWKTRMLKAGLGNSGLTMPDDWDTLDEATKEERLNGAIGALTT